MSREYWVEANIDPVGNTIDFLCQFVDQLIQTEFRGQLLNWHYFFEPDIRLRFEWKSARARKQNNQKLFSILDDWKRQGIIRDWYEGHHGRVMEPPFTGEGWKYGEEIWPYAKKVWTANCEMVLAILKNQKEGKLTYPPEYHWSRTVHLLSNELGGEFALEILGCLKQARGYTKRLQMITGIFDDGSWANEILDSLDKILEEGAPQINKAQDMFLAEVKTAFDWEALDEIFQELIQQEKEGK